MLKSVNKFILSYCFPFLAKYGLPLVILDTIISLSRNYVYLIDTEYISLLEFHNIMFSFIGILFFLLSIDILLKSITYKSNFLFLSSLVLAVASFFLSHNLPMSIN